MTARNPKTGGRIPPQGRSPQPPGVGRTARRHDLERPATPGLSGDLQQGEVSELEQGQAIAPRAGAKRTQPPASGKPRASKARIREGVTRSTGLAVPNPIDFAGQRHRATLGGSAMPEKQEHDFSGWFPLMQRIITTPGTSGPLTKAYMEQLSLLARRPMVSRLAPLNMADLDDSLGAALDDD